MDIKKLLSKGLRFSVFNFAIVALLGTLMRYKIAFSFPFLDQKYLQESHSHFAFYGWITSCIYMLITRYTYTMKPDILLKKYYMLISLNFAASFGMLFSFAYGGYNMVSIACATLALLTSFLFAFVLAKDLKSVKDHSKIWFLAGLFFAVISSVGVFGLGYMMMGGKGSQESYLALQYYYLHFQYNGFFIFSCIGLLLFSFHEINIDISDKENKTIFWLMFVGCVVGYGLSVLWAKLPGWLFGIIVIGTLMQTVGAVKIYLLVKKNWHILKQKRTVLERFILFYVGFAFAVKISLQLGSNIPAVNQFAFGFRNIVIAYLHLVLLMCIATFLINQIHISGIFKSSKKLDLGVKLLLIGIFLNEAILGLMGIFSIKYIAIPYTNEMLFAVSAFMLIAVIVIYSNLKSAEIPAS